MNLAQLTRYVDRARDQCAMHAFQQSLRNRYKISRRDKALTGGSRFAFDGTYDKLPLFVIRSIHYDDVVPFDGKRLGRLLETLYSRVGGNAVRVQFLENPDLDLNFGYCFGLSGWKDSRALMDATEVISWCLKFLTLIDVHELLDELDRRPMTKSAG